MHEGLTAQDAEEAVAHRFGFGDGSIRSVDLDAMLFGADIDPATLATEVAAVDDRKIKKGRKEFATFQSLFVAMDTSQASHTQRPSRFPQQAFIGLGQQPFSKTQIHGGFAVQSKEQGPKKNRQP